MEQISNLLDLVVSMNSGGRRGTKAVDADGLETWREALGVARQAFRDAERARSAEDTPDAERPVPVNFRQEGGPLETTSELPLQAGGSGIGPPLVLLDTEEPAFDSGTADPVPVETVPTARLPLPLVASGKVPEVPAEPRAAIGVELGSRDAQLDGVTVRNEAPVAAEPSTTSARAASPAPTPIPAQPQVEPQQQVQPQQPQVEPQQQVQPQQPQVEPQQQVQPQQPQVEPQQQVQPQQPQVEPQQQVQPQQPQVEPQKQVQPQQPQVEPQQQVQPQQPQVEPQKQVQPQQPQVEPQQQVRPQQPQAQPAPTIAGDVAAEAVPPAVAETPSAVATAPSPAKEIATPVIVETGSATPLAKPVETPSADVTVEDADGTVTQKPAASTETPIRPEPQATDGTRSAILGDEPVKEEPRVVVDEQVPEAIIDDGEPVNVEVGQPADPIDTETPADTPAIASAVDVRPRTVERRVDAGVARRSVGRSTRFDSTAASAEPIHVERPQVDDRPRMVPHKSGVATDDTEIKLSPADEAPQPVDPKMTLSKQPAPSQNSAPELARAAVREYASAPAASDTAPAPASEPTAPVSDSTVGGMQADALDGAKPQQAAARVHHQALATAIAAKARAVPQDGSVELRFALEPEDLGAVRVRIESRGDQLKIRIIASSGAAMDSLSSGIGKLASQLTEPGMKEPEIDLTFSDTAEHSEHSDRDRKGETTQAGSAMSETSGDLASTAPTTRLDNNSGSTTQLDRMA